MEYRSRTTRIVGERFFIYASKKLAAGSWQQAALRQAQDRWRIKSADNIAAPTEKLPDWMVELAEQVGMIEPGTILPTGVIVGSAVIEKVEEVASGQWPVASRASFSSGTGLTTDHGPLTTLYKWHLVDVQRAKAFRKPKKHPQPVWFDPF